MDKEQLEAKYQEARAECKDIVQKLMENRALKKELRNQIKECQ